ncbi:hypothetical protein BD414DRAFT_491377 [Trametes punicea]|nr:hypothetical protein BD414DRAFT_491377 [Trametes punicea]
MQPPQRADSAGTCATAVRRASKAPSWHCRSCLREPCEKPVATACGHIFCHQCIMREIEANSSCPVCQTRFLVKLDVAQ